DYLCDHQVGGTTGVLFFSILPIFPPRRYRVVAGDTIVSTQTTVIHQRIERLGQTCKLRLLLLMFDIVRRISNPVRELTKLGTLNSITVIVAW
ncbi:hypothetical protein EDB85DRAFT_1850663, partial [Lactarius pseudohatsudake]